MNENLKFDVLMMVKPKNSQDILVLLEEAIQELKNVNKILKNVL